MPCCMKRAIEIVITLNIQIRYMTQIEWNLTQRPVSLHGLDVHESGQVGADGDDVVSCVFVSSLDAATLPVGPVDVRPEQRKAIRVLNRRNQCSAVRPIQIRRFNSL